MIDLDIEKITINKAAIEINWIYMREYMIKKERTKKERSQTIKLFDGTENWSFVDNATIQEKNEHSNQMYQNNLNQSMNGKRFTSCNFQ